MTDLVVSILSLSFILHNDDDDDGESDTSIDGNANDLMVDLYRSSSSSGSSDELGSFSSCDNDNDHHDPQQRFQRQLDHLKYSESDLAQLLQQKGGFRRLQQSLRKSGAVTNQLLKQGLHFYVRDQLLLEETTNK